MSELESLINNLLSQRPDLSRAELDERIRQKKEKIGAGYLTDQGAVFLVASDLGIHLGGSVEAEVGLKDLFAGANEISLKVKMLSLAPTRHLTRKDGSSLLLRTMAVYDGDATASVKIWDEKANMPGLNDLKPGDLIRIAKAYTKTDLNGTVAIHIGSSSSVERLHESSDIPDIGAIAVDVSGVADGQKDLVVKGTVDGPLTVMEFSGPQGQPRKALKMRLKGASGNSVQVILWGKDESGIPQSVPPNAQARLAGVLAKSGRYGQLEIHGNEGTGIKMDGSEEIKEIRVRIISSNRDEAGNCMILGVDAQKNMYTMKDTSRQTEGFGEGDVLACMPSKSFGNAITLNDSSYVSKKEDDPQIPAKSDLRTKVGDIGPGGIYCIEAIILKSPEIRDISTKSGDVIQLGEMFVEDDTGQIWVKGWRNLAGPIAGLKAGQIVSVAGANAKPGLDGRTELFLAPFSSITEKEA